MKITALEKKGHPMPSLGHDKEASEIEILDALRLSKEPMHITHLFNVCSFHHRLPGLVNIGLASVYPNFPEYTDIIIKLIPPTVEVIGDLAHVEELTSDFDASFDMSVLLEARRYEMIVSSDCKRMLLKGTNTLAGSCVSMLDIFHNLLNTLNVPIPQAVRMLAENPAKVAGLKGLGSIAMDNRADLLLFDKDLTLTATMVAVNTVWKK
uniref:Amidohydrolase-related domain-containing protein n=1 Tax=Amphimedon queenslandica TaxID=400682 RepID=A0A1X7TI57_AMPQE